MTGGRARGLVSIGAAVLALFVALAAEEVDVTGTWDIALEIGKVRATPSMVLRQQGEKLSGDYHGRLGDSKLEGTIHGRALEFRVTLRFQDQPVTVVYEGTVDGDRMQGSARFGGDRGSGTWTARRKR